MFGISGWVVVVVQASICWLVSWVRGLGSNRLAEGWRGEEWSGLAEGWMDGVEWSGWVHYLFVQGLVSWGFD